MFWVVKHRNRARWELPSITEQGAEEPGPNAGPPRQLLMHPNLAVAKGFHAWNRKLSVDTLVWGDRRPRRRENAVLSKTRRS